MSRSPNTGTMSGKLAPMFRRAPIHDEDRAARTPPPWRVWQVVRATLVALLLVVVAYGIVGALVIYNGHEDQKSDDRQAADRRAGLCEAITEKAPEALARAFRQPLDSPELAAYKADLRKTLGFCPEPKAATP